MRRERGAETQMRHVFTVFTATFNRARVLHRVYDSLRAQTFRDLEWLVVDDGSSDGTGALVAAWRAEADFPIRYRYLRAAGVGAAQSLLGGDTGARAAATAARQRSSAGFSAVTVLCMDEEGRIVGDRFPRRIRSRLLCLAAFPLGWGVYARDLLRAR